MQEHVEAWIRQCPLLKDAARHLGVTVRTLRNWLDEGRIFAVAQGRSHTARLTARGRPRFVPPDPVDDSEQAWDD